MTEHYPYPKMPYGITQRYIRRFLNIPTDENTWPLGWILTIFGQHDMNQHQGIVNTPLWTMEAAQALWVLEAEDPFTFTSPTGQQIHIHGHTYNSPVPQVTSPEAFNILLTHQMVSDRDHWHGHVDFTNAIQLLRRLSDYDLIVCGDNHISFRTNEPDSGRWLVNCGSLMRSTITQKNHKPIVYVFDTEERSLQPFYIPIDPPETVFSEEEAIVIRDEGEEINPFVQEIRARRHGVGGMSFVDTVNRVLQRRNVSSNVDQLVREILANAHNEYGND